VGESGERLGDEGATESKLGDGAGKGLGDGGTPFISSSLGSIMDGETDISKVAPGISMPREPVDESRTSISDIRGRDASAEGVELEVVDSVRGAMVGFTWTVNGLVVGVSGLSLPIDIFFKKPHFPGC
jgi:hypothetical protein